MDWIKNFIIKNIFLFILRISTTYGNLIYIKAITQALFLDLNKFLFFDPITLLKNPIELRYFDTCRKIQFPTIFLKIA